MNIGGGQELKDGYYVPCTIAGCGKRTKGQLVDIPEANSAGDVGSSKESLSFNRPTTKGRFKTANRSDSENSKPNTNIY